jgi:hypothetical protein
MRLGYIGFRVVLDPRAAGFPGLYLITPLNRFDVIRGILAEVG